VLPWQAHDDEFANFILRPRIVDSDRPHMTIWSMRIARLIPKATETHSEYVTLVAFSQQRWLHGCPSMLVIRTLDDLLRTLQIGVQEGSAR
jgi:hypothetical protein